METRPPSHRTVHVLIDGRVQGVGYRAWAFEQARALGLAGWVRNRRDGTVEAVFSGPPVTVADMLQACWRGPAAADVANVIVLAEDAQAPSAFEVRTTQ